MLAGHFPFALTQKYTKVHSEASRGIVDLILAIDHKLLEYHLIRLTYATDISKTSAAFFKVLLQKIFHSISVYGVPSTLVHF